MTPREAVALATVVQAYFPSQPISEFGPEALCDLLAAYTFEDCKAAVKSRALRLTNTEGQKWCAPTDVYAEVRRMRAKAIAEDESLELPPHDPDNPRSYIQALIASREASLAGQPVEAEGLVRRNLRELGGPVRRVNELDDEDRTRHAERLRERRAVAELTEQPAPTPEPAPVFVCEHGEGETRCGAPAPHVSPDRRRPLCQVHAANETTKESA